MCIFIYLRKVNTTKSAAVFVSSFPFFYLAAVVWYKKYNSDLAEMG